MIVPSASNFGYTHLTNSFVVQVNLEGLRWIVLSRLLERIGQMSIHCLTKGVRIIESLVK